ncbi:hypothetical protein FGG08_004107 [Glutinoglossum americanum]|uniref:Uncharacterized protein n=1 Tax=Glutinoglossum americanum TaxID=1670608 RepID=A0A9P8KXF3_9PEZI|nr:hypothetical protein FGG08_004107 [Glutinoglossum americanum]
MTATTAPSIPPRPNRSQKHLMAVDAPKVPPRPTRRVERSVSPNRDSFARSPLNETPFAINPGDSSGGLYSLGQNISASSLPPRPPSVSLPSIGQEGAEYASFCDIPAEPDVGSIATESPKTQTRNIGNNLKLHAPKPTLPISSAKVRTVAVARTDSTQATAAGIDHADDKDPHTRPLKAKVSFTSHDSSQGAERPASTQPSDSEHGIPEIGLRVPMYPNAGDVQAPSPSAYQTTLGSGVGFHNDGQHRPGRNHKRTPSGRECPPGSYGLHGHGAPGQNKFEKAWYESHPEALEREESGEYGPGLGVSRTEWALSSDDLNRVVRETASKGAGYGTSPAIDGTPDEQIGYLASEEYASRITSPNPPSHHGSRGGSQTFNASRLREEITRDAPSNRQSLEIAVADEPEDEDVIHVNPQSSSRGDIGIEDLGPQGCNISEHGGWIDEHSYGVPILASDEVTKEPAAEHLQPAVSPYQERKGNSYFTSGDLERSGSRTSSRPTSTPASRSTSRPNSIIGGIPGFSRYALYDDLEELSTPLEDVEEYEPLFPEDEKGEKPKSPLDRLKRPELNTAKSSSLSSRSQRRKFPSQDIWEDAPSSAQLQATVTNPQLPEDNLELVKCLEENTEGSPGAVKSRQVDEAGSFLPQETREWANPKIKDELKNSKPKQRFPSKDIWEDSPESLQLQTTVSAPQTDESESNSDVPERPMTDAVTRTHEQPVSERESQHAEGIATAEIKPALEKPTPPPRPTRSKELTAGTAGVQPNIPARPPQRVRNLPPADIPPMPAKSPTPVSSGVYSRAVPPPPAKADDSMAEPTSSPMEKKAPVLPERSKPQIPARPAKPVTKKSGDSVGSSTPAKTGSASSTEGSSAIRSVPPPPTARPKPAVPSRPNGGKLAALKAGFFSDLDRRLQQGPTAPKQQNELAEEQTAEKAPLSDARKGRARGPVRRKPAVSPSANSEETNDQRSPQKFDISVAFTVWQIAEDGVVAVSSEDNGPNPEPTNSSNKTEIDSLDDIVTSATGVRNLLDNARDSTRVSEGAQEEVNPVSRESTQGQTIASERSATEIQDEDPAARSPTIEAAATMEAKGASAVSEPNQTSEQAIHTDIASTMEN